MFNAKKTLFNKLDPKNWHITTDNFNEPRLVHKKLNIEITREEIEKANEYCAYLISIFDWISKSKNK